MKRMVVCLLLAGAAHADPARPASNPSVVNNCLMCHSEELIAQQRLTAKQWQAVVKKMIGWGAPVEAAEVEPLTAWLAAQYSLEAGPFTPAPLDVRDAEQHWQPQPDGPLARGTIKHGQATWTVACAACHGADARGTPTGMNLADRPILWRAADFATVVRKGRGRMPAVPLTNSDLGSLLRFLRSR